MATHIRPIPEHLDDASVRRPVPRAGVILAAGRSERLARLTRGGSKVLTRLAGLPLIERAARTLLDLGLEDVVVVVGYEADAVAAKLKDLAPGRIRVVHADRWERGNGASLGAVEPIVSDEPLFVLVTADHVFSPGALEPLVRSGRPAVLVDHAPDRAAWDEGTRVQLHGERAIGFSKQIDAPEIDCGAFLLPPDIFGALRTASRGGDHTLSGAVTTLATALPLAVVGLPPGAWWQDVDTPDDLRLATRRLRTALTKPEDGPVSRYLNRPISSRISMLIAPLRIAPNAISMIAFLVGIAGAISLGVGAGIAGGLLVHVMSVLDGVDGETARLQHRMSATGALLDGVLDRLTDAAVVAGLAVWAVGGSDASAGTIAVLAITATAVSTLSMATKDRMRVLGLPPANERAISWLLGGRDGRLLIVATGAILGMPVWTLSAVTVAAGLALAGRLSSALVGWRTGSRVGGSRRIPARDR